MNASTLVLVLIAITVASYYGGVMRSQALARPLGGIKHLSALPSYYGFMAVTWAVIPALILLLVWTIYEASVISNMVIALLPSETASLSEGELGLLYSRIANVASGIMQWDTLGEAYRPAVERMIELQTFTARYKPILVISLAVVGALIALKMVSAQWNVRYPVERIFNILLFLCSGIAVLITVGIVFSVVFESLRFFGEISFFDFVFGTQWSPQIAIRADQVGASGAFGVIPLLVGTMLISIIAMFVAVPVGLMSAIYLSEYASVQVRNIVKPLLEILAGIPTIVYGFFAAITVAPAIRAAGEGVGLEVASESALAAGLVMGVMIIPFVSSLSDDVINAVPNSLRDGSYGLGATQSETIRKVIIPAALPGIVGGVLLAVSRAIGETMIVVMAAGSMANLTVNPLEAVTTVTVQIVTLLVGDQEFDNAKTLAAFALGLMLFVITLGLNFIALYVVKKYREQYD
ncbi:MAG: phosphate ABC transporter permease subunit PstC [Proteobacteria bacterium]|jgi:phosphate transport system permease protein|nr:phosphate ABC transporter permease subunit PstC [Pseudomonadota bacterium]